MACGMVIVLFLDLPAWSLGDRRTGVEVVIAFAHGQAIGACGSVVASEMVIILFFYRLAESPCTENRRPARWSSSSAIVRPTSLRTG